MHQPIFIKDLGLSFAHKPCFESFSTTIYPGGRIGIVGRNGSGKSSLLKLIQGILPPSSGEVLHPPNLGIGYVEQTIADFNDLSGGERLNKRLSEALAMSPDLLLLDEPTNHLDKANRKSLIAMLKHFVGTLIVVSHDKELLASVAEELWYIDSQSVHTFTGSIDSLQAEIKAKRESIEKELSLLKLEKKKTHKSLMKEQKRAAGSSRQGQKSIENRKWPTVVSKAKAHRSEKTSGKKRQAIYDKQEALAASLKNLRVPETIQPRFSIKASALSTKTILSISEGAIGFNEKAPLLSNINLTVAGRECVAILGDNGSGKSTLLKALLQKEGINRAGDWLLPGPKEIGYLDQHYANLEDDRSILELLAELRPDWGDKELRAHLNTFLFRKNHEVELACALFSGGEKARASLSLIAANTPKLLILDEITNNLDLETKDHVLEVLSQYPGALIVVSHEGAFLESLSPRRYYQIRDGSLIEA